MRTIHDPAIHADLTRRLTHLRAESPRRWGTMTANEMVCHVTDAYRMGLGELPVAAVKPPVPKFLLRLMVFRLPVPWPKGVPTASELKQGDRGTSHEAFDTDVARLQEKMDAFAAMRSGWPEHPAAGVLTAGDWGRWGFRHADHHFRQFGI